jgi:hypothetical protein
LTPHAPLDFVAGWAVEEEEVVKEAAGSFSIGISGVGGTSVLLAFAFRSAKAFAFEDPLSLSSPSVCSLSLLFSFFVSGFALGHATTIGFTPGFSHPRAFFTPPLFSSASFGGVFFVAFSAPTVLSEEAVAVLFPFSGDFFAGIGVELSFAEA